MKDLRNAGNVSAGLIEARGVLRTRRQRAEDLAFQDDQLPGVWDKGEIALTSDPDTEVADDAVAVGPGFSKRVALVPSEESGGQQRLREPGCPGQKTQRVVSARLFREPVEDNSKEPVLVEEHRRRERHPAIGGHLEHPGYAVENHLAPPRVTAA